MSLCEPTGSYCGSPLAATLHGADGPWLVLNHGWSCHRGFWDAMVRLHPRKVSKSHETGAIPIPDPFSTTDAVAPEESRQAAQARRGPVLFQRVLHLAQVDLRSRLVGLQDRGRMRFDPMRVPVPAHRLGGNLPLGPVPGMPADRARSATPNRSAACPHEAPASTAAITRAQVQRQNSSRGELA